MSVAVEAERAARAKELAARRRAERRSLKRLAKRVPFYLLIAIIFVFALFPFYWAVRSAFTRESDLFVTPVQYLPSHPTLENFRHVLSNNDFQDALMNSSIVAGSVTLLALAATAIAALRFIDPVESLAWAAAASLVVLPVTWYHYPSALIPFALVALLRAGAAAGRRVRILVAGAALVAAIAIAILPLLYVAIGLVLAAVRSSRPAPIASREPATLPAGASA